MKSNVNMKHPRLFKDGETRRVPLCIGVGRLSKDSAKEIQGMDQLGIGVSIYFKLLKSIIFLFTLCFILAIPLISIYWQGLAVNQLNSQV